MAFLQEYYRQMLDDLPDAEPEARLEYRPLGAEDLELLQERGLTTEEIGKILADPEGADAVEALVGMERLGRFQDPSGFRDEELSQALAELLPGREMEIPAFRALLAAHDALRGYFITWQCARLAYDMH